MKLHPGCIVWLQIFHLVLKLIFGYFQNDKDKILFWLFNEGYNQEAKSPFEFQTVRHFEVIVFVIMSVTWYDYLNRCGIQMYTFESISIKFTNPEG